jgi:hypothetical protein
MMMLKALLIVHIVIMSTEIMGLLVALTMVLTIKRLGIEEREPDKYKKSMEFWTNTIFVIVGLASVNPIITTICLLGM